MNIKEIWAHLSDPITLRGLIVVGATIGLYTAPQADAIFNAVIGLVGLYAVFKPKAPAAA